MRKVGVWALLAFLWATPGWSMNAQERVFLGPDGLAAREATIGAFRASETHSTVTNQGGNSGKPCDAGAIPANVMTQVSSDNAGANNGIVGPWEQTGGGFVTIENNHAGGVFVTADLYFGDQTACGANLGCYFHVTPGQYLHLIGNSGLQVGWSLHDTIPLNPLYENDWVAYFLFITASNSLSCVDNSYFTEEHN